MHGFHKSVLDALEGLHMFVRQIGMHEDLGSRPYHWLRADYVALFLVVEDKESQTFRILVEVNLIDAEFVVCVGGRGGGSCVCVWVVVVVVWGERAEGGGGRVGGRGCGHARAHAH